MSATQKPSPAASLLMLADAYAIVEFVRQESPTVSMHNDVSNEYLNSPSVFFSKPCLPSWIRCVWYYDWKLSVMSVSALSSRNLFREFSDFFCFRFLFEEANACAFWGLEFLRLTYACATLPVAFCLECVDGMFSCKYHLIFNETSVVFKRWQ